MTATPRRTSPDTAWPIRLADGRTQETDRHE